MNTLKKALEMLEEIVVNPAGVRPSTLAKKFGMSLPNAYKYLKVFEEYGFVVKKPDGSYIPSFKIVELSSIILRRLDIRDISVPFLLDLMIKTGQTVHLIMKDGFEGVYVHKIEGANSIPMVSKIGMKMDLYSTSAGKAILAFLPEDELEEYLRTVKLVKKTERTITDPEELKKELKLVRERGYAIDDEENEPGIRCVGSAILNHEGYPIAAVSISGASSKVTMDWIKENARHVVDCARKISSKLGYSGGE